MSTMDYYIGLISGTSVDGVDAALVNFAADMPELVATHSHAIPDTLRSEVLELCKGSNISLSQLGSTHIELGRLFAEAVEELLAQSGIDRDAVAAIGNHGQTVWHEPDSENPFTLQLVDANTLAYQTGIAVVGHIRGRDIAAGGQGAPLAPLLHQHVFSSSNADRAIINIGGFSNITCLCRDSDSKAFDAGPGNVLMDYWIDKHLGKKFDENGDWARSGKVNSDLLALLLEEPYFAKPLPKSTGRELFNGDWLSDKLSQLSDSITPEDVQATLLELTARSLADALHEHCNANEVFVCGGGAHNTALMEALSAHMENCKVESTQAIGMDPDWVEAVAFAWIARETLAGRKIDTTKFTGASEPIILGGIYRA